ncbi:prepilin-type N-terminal cleavage/methylation domain-containing protein [Mitsuaria sp. GD03876]|uniref:prepilin-type N-terminal cleavage/methylation domain-containing protein n=1 Tax=Mitsuaria sp. GD03876 TaxID=2975399 RepID=UPI00244B1F23|nr:prepilin-type N-terminal cleavage/methylation domain-containing protein [Mitsuaria sp. GD03876]MDH0867009.1 prepilin-type N-terminal cleavage/methylation domain-containing protein [Mitsuaria sp. GD03876]
MPLPAPSRPRPGAMPPRPMRRQSGFSLLELSMATFLTVVLTIAMLEMEQFDRRAETGRHDGQRLDRVFDGVMRYARERGAALLDPARLARCGMPALPSTTAPTTSPEDCGLTVRDQTVVADPWRPTLDELRDLRYVAPHDLLPLPLRHTLFGGHGGPGAMPALAIVLACVERCQPVDGAPDPEAVMSVTMHTPRSLYATGNLPFGAGAQLHAMRRALGPVGFISLPGESPEQARHLRGWSGQQILNPVAGEQPGTGTPGVVAAHATVRLNPGPARQVAPSACGDVAGAACRDGSAPPTARWDFNGQDLDRVGQLGTRGLAVHERAVFDGQVRVRSELRVGPEGPPRPWQPHGLLALNKSDLRISDGSLRIDRGIADFGSHEVVSTLGGIRLPTTKGPGTACDPTGNDPSRHGGNLGLFFDGESMHVMVCRPQQQSAWGGPDAHRARPMHGIWTRTGDARADHLVRLPR